MLCAGQAIFTFLNLAPWVAQLAVGHIFFSQIYSSKTKFIPYERALCAQERAHMRTACVLQTRALSRIIQVN